MGDFTLHSILYTLDFKPTHPFLNTFLPCCDPFQLNSYNQSFISYLAFIKMHIGIKWINTALVNGPVKNEDISGAPLHPFPVSTVADGLIKVPNTALLHFSHHRYYIFFPVLFQLHAIQPLPWPPAALALEPLRPLLLSTVTRSITFHARFSPSEFQSANNWHFTLTRFLYEHVSTANTMT